MAIWMQSTALALALSVSAISAAQDPVAPWEEDLDAFLTVLMAEHDNPYFLTPEAEFNTAVAEYRAALPDLDRAERIAGFARIIALVGDGHTWMPMHGIPHDPLLGPGFRSLPVRFDVFEEGVFIVGAPTEYADYAGAQVLSFGETQAANAHAAVMSVLPQDAVNFAAELAPEWLMQAELLAALGVVDSAETVTLTLLKDGVQTELALTPMPTAYAFNWIYELDTGPAGPDGPVDWVTAEQDTPLWRENFAGNWRTIMLEDAVYLQINAIRDGGETSYAAMAQAAVDTALTLDAPSLVVDLRRCAGGDGTLNAGLMAAITSAPELEGRVAVLISRATHSAAVMLVSDFEQHTSARFYGQPTADRPNHYGETNFFMAPNSGLPVIHASEYYQTSSPDDDRRFLTPDVLIPYRFADYAAGTDPVLAQALADFTE